MEDEGLEIVGAEAAMPKRLKSSRRNDLQCIVVSVVEDS